jgi:hypothetical protein
MSRSRLPPPGLSPGPWRLCPMRRAFPVTRENDIDERLVKVFMSWEADHANRLFNCNGAEETVRQTPRGRTAVEGPQVGNAACSGGRNKLPLRGAEEACLLPARLGGQSRGSGLNAKGIVACRATRALVAVPPGFPAITDSPAAETTGWSESRLGGSSAVCDQNGWRQRLSWWRGVAPLQKNQLRSPLSTCLFETFS